MTNAEKPLLIDTINFQRDIAPYKFIKIFSGVGSGKTMLACSMILGNSEKHIPKQTVLLITSRRSTVEETLKKVGGNAGKRAIALGNIPADMCYDDMPSYNDYVRIIKEDDDLMLGDITVHNMSVVCTNAHIEQYFKRQYIPSQRSTHLWELFDTIIVDEVHSLITDATYQSAPFYVLELINEFLRRCAEHDIQNEDKKHLILMTGTSEPLAHLEITPFDERLSVVHQFFDRCPNVQPKTVLVIDKKTAYYNLHGILEQGGKAIWFSNHVVTKREIRDNWRIADSIRVEVSFSSDDAKRDIGVKEAEQMKQIDDFVAANRRLPDDVRLFVTTSRNKEGINIENEDIRFMFVESHFSDDVIQMAGRLRAGAQILYIISDTKQLCNGTDTIAATFSSKGIAPLRNAFSDSNCGYANEYLQSEYGSGKFADLPLNSKADELAYTAYGSYIDYIHKTFPYVRYSYILNRFVFYRQRELAEIYTLDKCTAFSNALIGGNNSIKKLLETWFPSAAFRPMISVEERCKEYIENTIFVSTNSVKVKLTSEQVRVLRAELEKITEKSASYLNPVLNGLGYELSKRDSLGYYWISKVGKKPKSRYPGKHKK